jgi:hypothetical protein
LTLTLTHSFAAFRKFTGRELFAVMADSYPHVTRRTVLRGKDCSDRYINLQGMPAFRYLTVLDVGTTFLTVDALAHVPPTVVDLRVAFEESVFLTNVAFTTEVAKSLASLGALERLTLRSDLHHTTWLTLAHMVPRLTSLSVGMFAWYPFREISSEHASFVRSKRRRLSIQTLYVRSHTSCRISDDAI